MVLVLFGEAAAVAQEASPIGRVRVNDAQIAGALEVSGGEAVLHGAATVTARDRTAELRLERGGEVQVCQTSVLHVTMGPVRAGAPAPLLLGLDRGAMQVHTAVTSTDALITPDLRFTVERAGLLNLGIRVVPNGDTCVDNSGAGAPVLNVGEQLGGASYQLRPGQHVLFERGGVREVVDHETSPCGCPPVMPPELLAGTGGGGAVPGGGRPAGVEHPFPAAESEGLTAGAGAAGTVPQAPTGQVHAQVGATLAYGEAGADDGTGMKTAEATGSGTSTGAVIPGASGSAPRAGSVTGAGGRGPGTVGSDASGTANPTAPVPTPPTIRADDRGGVLRRLGRFFRNIFG